MIYLTDNDVIEKLAVCHLLDDALFAFGAARNDVLVLPTLKHRIGIGSPRPKMVKRLGAEVATRLVEFLSTVREISDYSKEDHQLLEGLDNSVQIDAGEIVLFSATAGIKDYLLLTGDKRCIRALATTPECVEIARRIQGHVVCFEQIILKIINVLGFEEAKAKIVPTLAMSICDTALRAAFGSGMDATQDNVVACLRNYIGEIRGYPLDLLITGP